MISLDEIYDIDPGLGRYCATHPTYGEFKDILNRWREWAERVRPKVPEYAAELLALIDDFNNRVPEPDATGDYDFDKMPTFIDLEDAFRRTEYWKWLDRVWLTPETIAAHYFRKLTGSKYTWRRLVKYCAVNHNMTEDNVSNLSFGKVAKLLRKDWQARLRRRPLLPDKRRTVTSKYSARNKWIHAQRKKGRSLQEILDALPEEKPEWAGQLNSVQAIQRADLAHLKEQERRRNFGNSTR
jgi:hypothetical protein